MRSEGLKFARRRRGPRTCAHHCYAFPYAFHINGFKKLRGVGEGEVLLLTPHPSLLTPHAFQSYVQYEPGRIFQGFLHGD